MNKLENKLIGLFEYLHCNPELGFEEFAATAEICKALEQEGIEILPSGLETGLIARITGRNSGRCIGLRCDIDALPIQEETGIAYASHNPGKMHACGHDAHAAIMLGAAILLNRNRDRLNGTVKIVFQPAEEVAGGAATVLNTRLLDDAELFLGVHSYPAFSAGTLGIKKGPVMAAVDRFSIQIHGRGAHAAQPHKGIDPIAIQAAIVQSAQTIVSRSLNPFSPAVVSITHVESGNTWNVIPQEAYLEGTVRTLDPSARTQTQEILGRMVQSIAEAYGAQAELNWYAGPPAVVNDERLCQTAEETALDLGFRVAQQEDTLGGEDFSLYHEGRPGLFVRVGTGGDYPAHHPKFTIDPQAIYPAAQFFSKLTENLLKKGATI